MKLKVYNNHLHIEAENLSEVREVQSIEQDLIDKGAKFGRDFNVSAKAGSCLVGLYIPLIPKTQ